MKSRLGQRTRRASSDAGGELVWRPGQSARYRRLRDEELDRAYAAGEMPLVHIRPADRPPREVIEDDAALQEWLRLNAPALTREACKVNPPKRPSGYTLAIPGDGVTLMSDVDEPNAAAVDFGELDDDSTDDAGDDAMAVWLRTGAYIPDPDERAAWLRECEGDADD